MHGRMHRVLGTVRVCFACVCACVYQYQGEQLARRVLAAAAEIADLLQEEKEGKKGPGVICWLLGGTGERRGAPPEKWVHQRPDPPASLQGAGGGRGHISLRCCGKQAAGLGMSSRRQK